VKLATLAAICTALDCTPNDLFEVDTTPRGAAYRPGPAAGGAAEGGLGSRPVPAANLSRGRAGMGKKQRDCAGCGAPKRPGRAIPPRPRAPTNI
jgi:Cro/C1-type HTH DNA-binding domain